MRYATALDAVALKIAVGCGMSIMQYAIMYWGILRGVKCDGIRPRYIMIQLNWDAKSSALVLDGLSDVGADSYNDVACERDSNRSIITHINATPLTVRPREYTDCHRFP